MLRPLKLTTVDTTGVNRLFEDVYQHLGKIENAENLVRSLNDLTGPVSFTGSGGAEVTTSGATVTVSTPVADSLWEDKTTYISPAGNKDVLLRGGSSLQLYDGMLGDKMIELDSDGSKLLQIGMLGYDTFSDKMPIEIRTLRMTDGTVKAVMRADAYNSWAAQPSGTETWIFQANGQRTAGEGDFNAFNASIGNISTAGTVCGLNSYCYTASTGNLIGMETGVVHDGVGSGGLVCQNLAMKKLNAFAASQYGVITRIYNNGATEKIDRLFSIAQASVSGNAVTFAEKIMGKDPGLWTGNTPRFDYGLDFSDFTFNTAAMRVPSGSPIVLDGTTGTYYIKDTGASINGNVYATGRVGIGRTSFLANESLVVQHATAGHGRVYTNETATGGVNMPGFGIYNEGVFKGAILYSEATDLVEVWTSSTNQKFQIDLTNNCFCFKAQGTITKLFPYQADALADDGTVNLPDATSGMVFASCNAEAGMWLVQNDGACTKISGSTNTAATDSDTDLCVYDGGGTQAIVKNRLGATGEIRIIYFYN